MHGPVIATATVDGEPVALTRASPTFNDELGILPTWARLITTGAVTSGDEFRAALELCPTPICWYYSDRHGIAAQTTGRVPVRGASASSDFPTWGDGEHDWAGFDPSTGTFDSVAHAEMPGATDPAAGYIAGWNNRPQRGVPAADSVFWHSSFGRQSALADPARKAIRAGRTLDLADLARISVGASSSDLPAMTLYPLMREIAHAHAEPNASALARLDVWWQQGCPLSAQEGLLFVRWWREFLPRLLEPLLDACGPIEDTNLAPLHDDDVITWAGQLSKVLRGVLGRDVRDPLPALEELVGGGSRLGRVAAQSLVAALESASPDAPRAGEQRGTTMSFDTVTSFGELTFTANASVPVVRLQNRPTYHQIIEFHR